MRDGTKLFTALYAAKNTDQPYPIMLKRTPYGVGPYGVDNFPETLGPSKKFATEGFIFTYQDVRGRWNSEGEFVKVRPFTAKKVGNGKVDESSDAFDTIDLASEEYSKQQREGGRMGSLVPWFLCRNGVH